MHTALKIRNYFIHFTKKDEWQGILSGEHKKLNNRCFDRLSNRMLRQAKRMGTGLWPLLPIGKYWFSVGFPKGRDEAVKLWSRKLSGSLQTGLVKSHFSNIFL